MRVALVQFEPVFGEPDRNFARMAELAAQQRADVYIFPELALSGYQFIAQEEAYALSESVDGPRMDAMAHLASTLDACLIFGFAERDGTDLYNAAAAVFPDGQRLVYRKTHLFYKETLFFKPGNTGFFVFEYRQLHIGMAICFDWFFPESYRTLALLGADIVAHPSNLVLPYCQRADFAAAVQNRIYIATVNRTGAEHREEERLEFTGGSVLVSPKGEYLLQGSRTEEAILVADIDPAQARDKQLNPYNNVLGDRRPAQYRMA